MTCEYCEYYKNGYCAYHTVQISKEGICNFFKEKGELE